MCPTRIEGIEKMKKIIFVFVGFTISLLAFNDCNSSHSQDDRQQQSLTNNKKSELSDCYDKITKCSQKMQEEAKSYFSKTHFNIRTTDGDFTNIGNIYPTAVVALSEALNKGMHIDDFLSTIKQGEKVIANLQEIDGKCYHIERYCSDGIKQLENDRLYLTTSIKDGWISVLKRIKNYSSEIREQVQKIRELQ